MVYNFQVIEKKWQKAWETKKAFNVKEKKGKKKFYVLDMFPYPSGEGLHMGHAFTFSLGDVFARFKRLQGYNVLYPMGYDSFGLPAENAAIKAGTHPFEYTKKSMANFMKQQKAMGWSYDWDRLLTTSDPEYYKWDQWIFLQMLKKGLAYRKKSAVNYCKKCDTVLANEQVVQGKCWRHDDTNVEIKHLVQWYFKTTEYADELLRELDKLDWPERAKTMQRNWIGKSEGAEILFEINKEKWPVFTTRTDTIYGVTFMVVSAQHPRLMELVTDKQKKEVEMFLKKLKGVSEKQMEEMDKEGVFTGSYAINPINNEKVPVYAGNFVVADYGSGMVMAVPGHDTRDYEFAKKYKLTIKEVIEPLYINYNGSDAYRPDEHSVERHAAVAIIKNPKTNKYLLLRWKKNDWRGFVIGGIEKGEDSIEAAKREIIEETGYTDFKFIRKMPGFVHSKFYHELKKQNREAHFESVYFELNSDKRKNISDDEDQIHSIHWVDENKVSEFIERDNDMLVIWNKFISNECYSGPGILVNSENFNDLESDEAKEHIIKYLEEKKLGRKVVNYKLRDWLISRQRYWGTPIPVVYCEKCGIVPVPEKDLPVELPRTVKFGKGNPLATNDKWINIKCYECGGKAKRETDTMDTFANSSWYYLRYCDHKNKKKIFDSSKANYWCPIDQYIGGPEQITLHLIYARFYTKFLRDLGLINFGEPALKYFTQGIVKGSDGEKMSKSKGNVIEPLKTIEKYGADSLRLYLIGASATDSDRNWDEKGMQGSFKFLNSVYDYFSVFKPGKIDVRIESKLNKNVKEVTNLVEGFKHNLAIIHIRGFFDYINVRPVDKKTAEAFLQLLHIYCPFITEELWSKIGGKGIISLSSWPKVDENKINSLFEKEEELVEMVINDINNVKKFVNSAGSGFIYVIPNEKEAYLGSLDEIKKRTNLNIKVFAVNDKDKHDPQNKSKKAKPGKPGIYLE